MHAYMNTGAQLHLLRSNEGQDLSGPSQAGLEKSPVTKTPF